MKRWEKKEERREEEAARKGGGKEGHWDLGSTRGRRSGGGGGGPNLTSRSRRRAAADLMRFAVASRVLDSWPGVRGQPFGPSVERTNERSRSMDRPSVRFVFPPSFLPKLTSTPPRSIHCHFFPSKRTSEAPHARARSHTMDQARAHHDQGRTDGRTTTTTPKADFFSEKLREPRLIEATKDARAAPALTERGEEADGQAGGRLGGEAASQDAGGKEEGCTGRGWNI